MSCEVRMDGKSHSGVIRDLTPQGLFVTVRFEAEEGTPVDVLVRRPGGELWEIRARTVHRADGTAGRRGLISGRGLGLVIEEAPPSFHEFVLSLESLDPSSDD